MLRATDLKIGDMIYVSFFYPCKCKIVELKRGIDCISIRFEGEDKFRLKIPVHREFVEFETLPVIC